MFDIALEDKVQGVLRGKDVEIDLENNESCHPLKGKGNKGKIILKLFKRKDKKILFSEKKNATFWVTNGTVKIKMFDDQVRSVTHEVDLKALSQ